MFERRLDKFLVNQPMKFNYLEAYVKRGTDKTTPESGLELNIEAK